MNLKQISAVVLSSAALTVSAAALNGAVQVYPGRDLDDTLYDLGRTAKAKLVSHELSFASPLLRIDVLRLADGRLMAITSRAKQLGQPYTIDALRITPTAESKLTKDLATHSLLEVGFGSK